MIEQQLEERFRLAVADEPPLGFDPDDIVTRAARRQRNRRAVTSVVAAVVAVAAFAAVTNMVTTASYTDMPIQPAQQPPGLTCPDGDQAMSEMNELLARKTAEIVPALPYDPDPIGMAFPAQGPGKLCAVSAIWPSVSADRNSPSVGLLLQFVPDGEVTNLFTDQPAYVRTEEIKNPDGSVLSTYTKATPEGEIVSPKNVEVEFSSMGALSAPVAVVVHQRADGSVMRAESDDLALASVEQLKALATDPDIAF